MTGPLPRSIDHFLDLVATRVNDPQRLAAVAATRLLDTRAEAAFDRIAGLASRLLSTPFGFVTVVDDHRSHWKACVGIDATEPDERQNSVEESFCQYVIGTDDVFLIDDALLDERTRNNPSIVSMGVRAWAGAPLRGPAGHVLGTVCVVDTAARIWTESDGALLTELAAIATDEIAARQLAFEAVSTQTVLDQVLSQSPIGFALLDADLRFVMANQSLADLNGRSIADHAGCSVGELLPEVGPKVEPLLRSVLESGEPVEGVEILARTDAHPGTERVWSSTYFRIGTTPEEHRIGLLVSDITEQSISRRRAERLAVIAAELAAASSFTEVGTVVGHLIADYFGGSFAAAGSVQLGDDIRVMTDANNHESLSQVKIDLSKRTVYGEAFRTGSMILVPDTAMRIAQYPDAAPANDLFDALAALPLRRVDGTVNGAIVIGWPHAIAAEDFPRSQLVTVAEMLGQTLERVQASDERRALTEAMQRSLFAPIPSIPAIQLAARYVPATSTIGFGGDWYDVIELGHRRLALVIGDVVGHDPVAAAQMSTIRTIVATLVRQRTPLTQIFQDVDDLMGSSPEPIRASVVICLIDTDARTLDVASAGHPPLLIARSSGVVERVDQSLRPWIGVGGSTAPSTTVRYEPGAVVVAYSDGLIETRQGTIDDDIDRLADHLANRCTESATSIADSIVGHMAPSNGASDDVALIVARL